MFETPARTPALIVSCVEMDTIRIDALISAGARFMHTGAAGPLHLFSIMEALDDLLPNE